MWNGFVHKSSFQLIDVLHKAVLQKNSVLSLQDGCLLVLSQDFMYGKGNEQAIFQL